MTRVYSVECTVVVDVEVDPEVFPSWGEAEDEALRLAKKEVPAADDFLVTLLSK